MQLISTFYKEDADSRARAEVIDDNGLYVIHYYNAAGNLFRTQNFPGKSVRYVEDAAENWTLGIGLLNE